MVNGKDKHEMEPMYKNGLYTSKANHPPEKESLVIPTRTGDYRVDCEDDCSYDEASRNTWSRKTEYLLSVVGFCVGLGNIWRFPYVCIRNGGGAFLIPFLLCLALCGMPLFFLEVSLGQFLNKSALHVWSICPVFKGVGWSMIIISLLFAWYYLMILGWTLIYIVNSFKSVLPWTLCGQEWNSDSCVTPQGKVAALANGTSLMNSTGSASQSDLINGTLGALSGTNLTELTKRSSTEEFWQNNVLEISSGFGDLGGLPWHTAVALFVAAFIVCACVIKGVESLGKVVYVTATLPYILLTVLIIKGATLDGAIDGVLFYIKPDFSKLLTVQTWVEATIQVFYSLGPAYGGLITMSSYNKFSNNCYRDAVILSFICEGTSIFGGFAIFTVLGHMSHTLDVPISNFTSSGPGLAFVVYPEAISYLPLPQLWGVLFFVMLFSLGLDSMFACIETVLTAIADLYPKILSRWEILIKSSFMAALFLVALPFASRGGMYLFQLVDWYIAAFAILMNGILECIIVAWIYGAERFFCDIELMIGKKPSFVFIIIWRVITPFLLTTALVATLVSYTAPVYGTYVYGLDGILMGWFIACVSFVPIPVYIIYYVRQIDGPFREKIRKMFQPSEEWGPADPELREKYLQKEKPQLCSFRLPCSKV